MGSFGDTLHRWRLNDLPTTPEAGPQRCRGLSHSGNYIATAYKLETTITITDLHSQAPSQLIDAGVKIEGLVLTGNILLVFGSEMVVAWLLTGEGLVGGVFGGRRAGRSDSVWTISQLPVTGPGFKVEGPLGIIQLAEGFPRYFAYHTETGEILRPDKVPRHFGAPWKWLDGQFAGREYLGFHNLSQHNAPPDDGWQASTIAVRDGWVRDPEGRHRLWVPVEWRADWDLADWRHDIATQFSILGGKPVIIRFQ